MAVRVVADNNCISNRFNKKREYYEGLLYM